jgi:hypothetical protein
MIMKRIFPTVGGLVVAGCCGCATLLGFEDAVDLAPEALSASDGGAQPGEDGGGHPGDDERATHDAGSDASDMGSDADSDAGPSVPTGVCVPAPPTDWNGPLTIHERSGATPSSPSCAGAYPLAVFDGFDMHVAAAAACACSCASPSGVACSAPVVGEFEDTSCQSAKGWFVAPTCASIDSDATRVRVGPSQASGGSCLPASEHVLAPVQWSASVRLCGPPSPATRSTCPVGEVRTASTAPPFQPGNACIARDGVWDCPSSYPVTRTYYDSVTDTRGCTPCTCDAPAGTACATTAAGFTNSSCSQGLRSIVPGACVAVGSTERMVVSTEATGGACTASGGTPTGDVAAAGPKTVCCLQ